MLDFAADTQFLDVGGIPVTIGAGPGASPWMYCAAWDARPPRRFPLGNARAVGVTVTREKFLGMIGESSKDPRHRVGQREQRMRIAQDSAS